MTTIESVRNHLEKMLHAMVDAINTRDFNAEGWLWSDCVSGVRISLGFPSPYDTPVQIGLTEHLETIKETTVLYPEHHIRITGMSTHIDLDAGKAETFTNMEDTGHPPGLSWQLMGRTTWRRSRGQWLMIAYESVQGVDPTVVSPNDCVSEARA